MGCEAGRVALELQRRGREVVAIDVSPGAVAVARRRGVRDARVLAFERVDASLGSFGTIVMYGNSFGYLLVSPDELTEFVDGTGWRVRRLVRDQGSLYVVILDRA